MENQKKLSKLNIILFIVFLLLGTYFLIIETWLLPVKIIIFVILFLVLKSTLLSKKQGYDPRKQ